MTPTDAPELNVTPTSRISNCFRDLRQTGRKGLIPYITAGDPNREQVVALMQALVQAGADILELGVPFSDPMADGPVIQRSSERALARGVSLHDCLDWVADFRQTNRHTPVVLMGYANPIERFGLHRFVQQAKTSGVDGVLVVDYPPEECAEFSSLLRQNGLDPIFLLAPTSSPVRMQQVASLGSGYLYYVSLKGVTGAGHMQPQEVAQRVQQIRQYTDMPVGVGFGISDAASAVAVGKLADAVVIGSALIRIMESCAANQQDPLAAAQAFMSQIRVALDGQGPPGGEPA